MPATPCILSAEGPCLPLASSVRLLFTTSGSVSEWLAHFGSLSPRRPDLGLGAAAAAAAAADDNDTGSDDDDDDADDDDNNNNNNSGPATIYRGRRNAHHLPGRLID